ncbi:MAG: hypothetical protein JO022_15160 [Acidobacteriaceae bacterium]|nr:hypothetical protein [Acidobacteriaceae bacterium]
MPSIDERLQAIAINLEILTRDMQDTQQQLKRLDERERKARKALITGTIAYMNELEQEDQ